ncbi:hypothetical protein GGR57DRAFT_514310 [Xylariaceae sp. FL1272]|nr:hypothetical protein GGR57DRAFT_514310 [Xylariaceae sp. FL1272]
MSWGDIGNSRNVFAKKRGIVQIQPESFQRSPPLGTSLKRRRISDGDAQFDDHTDAKKYWMHVHDVRPPKPWASVDRIMKHLARIPPYKRPSGTRLWIEAKAWLEEAQKLGATAQWMDGNAFQTLPRTDSEL